MKMKAQTFWFIFVFLGLTGSLSYDPEYFTLEGSSLTATEGSCAEIKCIVTIDPEVDGNSKWFWMKDAMWNKDNGNFSGSIIYSSQNSSNSVSGDYATRVKYVGSSSSTWNELTLPRQCGIRICNLKKGDSGNYSFRFEGKIKWITKEIKLNVTDNLCPITLGKQPVIKESATLDLRCSTLTSCPSRLQLQLLGKPAETRTFDENNRTTTVAKLNASWNDDGREISCQTENNRDPYLIRRTNLTVEYAPKDIIATVTPLDVIEGQKLTLSCSAKGRPSPTFQWSRNGLQVSTQAQWTIPSVKYSEAGTYSCVAWNAHGSARSPPSQINVSFKPQVEVQKRSTGNVLKEGDALLLFCYVKKSNPAPHSYSWYKNGKNVGITKYKSIQNLQPYDGGSYTCQAKNIVGTGESSPLQISVQYRPRRTTVSPSPGVNVKVGQPLTLSCVTDANPAPGSYSWYRYNNKNQDDPNMSWSNKALTFSTIQRADEACYACSATNVISTGETSKPLCIFVHYPPTNLQLFMDAEATEGELITISCSVESFPASQLTLSRTSTLSSSPENLFPSHNQQLNNLRYEFKATAAHAGVYTCAATNTGGSQTTLRKLVVKYAPQDVRVQSESDLSVGEDTSLTLHCVAKSHPEAFEFRWMKTIDGKSEIVGKGQKITLHSVSPSDSGFYSCSATNEIGTGTSQLAKVKVKYAPKHTEIRMSAEVQQDDGRSSVTLTCCAHSDPPVQRFSWYKRAKGQERDVKMSDDKTFTVLSDQPGVYYCIAKNEINERRSGPITLFVSGDFIKFLLFLIILPVIALIVFAFRSRIKKSFQRKKNSCFSLLNDGDGAMRRMNQSGTADPSRSRDELLPHQLGVTEDQPCQNHPDSTPASGVTSIYSQLNLHHAAMTPSAETPVGQTVEDSLNYAALQFGKKKKDRKAEEEKSVVYAVVSGKKSPEKEERGLEDYENFSAALAFRTPNRLNDGAAESSEDEMELCYTRVHFTATPGCERGSGTCEGEETQYSEVKL